MSVYQIITDEIIKGLNEGIIPWRMPWDQTSDVNIKTRNGYRGINVVLLAMARRKNKFTSNYWVTFKQAKQMGGRVKAGAKSTMVVFWKMLEIENDATEKVDSVPMMRYYNVFNLDQVEGIEAPKTEERAPVDPVETAEKIVREYATAPDIQYTSETRAYYSPLGDYVNMPERKYFHGAPELYSTLFHELVHSTGHESRLKRFKDGAGILNQGRHEYSKEELVAEIGSAFLCHEVGIGKEVIENQTAYIQSWIKSLRNDPKMIVEASGKAQKAVDYMRNRKAGK